MDIIQVQQPQDRIPSFSLGYYAVLLLFFGINHILNFIRPITNLYIIYFDLDWAEFHILELFDIFNLLFGILLIVLGFLIFYYKGFTRSLLIFGGIIFILYNLIDPSHFLMFGNLLSIISGNPPVWMSVIPENLLGIYLSSWSVLSISHIILQIIGFYIAIRIIRNSNPQKAIIEYLFFYCWVVGLSGITLCLQSTIILSLTASWASISLITYIFRIGSWISMCFLGIAGLIFIVNWRKNQIQRKHIKFGQISLISFSAMLILISYSDFAMKTKFSLVLNSFIAGLLIIFAFKLPNYILSEEKLSKEKELINSIINK